MSSRAFALIELVAVLGIIALLAAIAIPIYKNYTNSAKIASAVQALAYLNEQAKLVYEQGGPTSPISIGGTIFSDNVTISYNYGSVVQAQYLSAGDGYIPANEWMFCVNVTGLNFPSYSDPIGGSGNHDRICQKTKIVGTVYTVFCGVWDPSSIFEIPQQYLPTGCNCASVSGESC